LAKKYWNKLKEDILKIIQSIGKCQRCGFSDIRALEIHHTKEGKSKNDYKEMKLIIEGKIQYEVLCANCHTIEHNPRNLNPLYPSQI